MDEVGVYIILVLAVGIVVIVGGIAFITISSNKRESQIRSHNQQVEEERRAIILRMEEEWGHDICEAILAGKIQIDMTSKMVYTAWGEPSAIDQKEVTKTGQVKERWVYGIPRKGANYVWFVDGKVTKIKTG